LFSAILIVSTSFNLFLYLICEYITSFGGVLMLREKPYIGKGMIAEMIVCVVI